MTDTEATEAARKRLAEERKATEQSRAEFAERQKGKPTPTQEENDLAALGAHLIEKEHDGSGPDSGAPQTRQIEAKKPAAGDYQTRHAAASKSKE